NFDAAADEFRKITRSQSAAARHDLVICSCWKDFCISVGSDDRRLLLRLFRSQGSASHRIFADCDRICTPVVAGGLLLAPDRNSLESTTKELYLRPFR